MELRISVGTWTLVRCEFCSDEFCSRTTWGNLKMTPSTDCWDHRFTFDRCCFLGEARFCGGPLRIAFGVSWLFVSHGSKFRSWDNQNTSDRADWSATEVGQSSPEFSSCLLFGRKWAKLPTRNLKRLIQAVLIKVTHPSTSTYITKVWNWAAIN